MSMMARARVFPVATAVLCSGVVLGPLFQSVDIVIQMSIDRILLAAGILLFAIRYLQNSVKTPALKKVDYVLFALVGWLLFRAIPAIAPPGVEPPFGRWLTFIAIPLAMYLLARFAPLEVSDSRILISALIGLGVYLGITGFFEVVGAYPLVFPKYIVDQSNWEFLGRARGPLLNPTGNGIVLTTAFAATIMRIAHGSQNEKVGYSVAACIIGVGILATLTRSVWIGAFLVSVLFSWVYARRLLVPAGLFGTGLLLLFLTVGSTSGLLEMKRDKHLSAADAATSVKLRPVLATVAADMIVDSPLIGHGYGGYFHNAAPYLANRSHEAALESVRPYMQHNIVLSFLVDAGLIAVCLFCTWMFIVARFALKMLRSQAGSPESRTVGMVTLGCMIAYMFNGMFHDVSVIPMASNFLYFMSGMTLSVAYGTLGGLPGTNPVSRESTIGNEQRGLVTA